MEKGQRGKSLAFYHASLSSQTFPTSSKWEKVTSYRSYLSIKKRTFFGSAPPKTKTKFMGEPSKIKKLQKRKHKKNYVFYNLPSFSVKKAFKNKKKKKREIFPEEPSSGCS